MNLHVTLAIAFLVLHSLCLAGAAHVEYTAVANTEDAMTTLLIYYFRGPKGTKHKQLQYISSVCQMD